MISAKLENELNLSLEATDEEREKSIDLGVGFNRTDKTWQLIVLHDGTLERHMENEEEWKRLLGLGLRAEFLLANYAIITTPQMLIQEIVQDPSILFIEKPNRLLFEVINGKRASCISSLQGSQRDSLHLNGEGTLIGIIDSGIDASLKEFQFADGSSKVVSFWDQNRKEGAYDIKNAVDLSGHGTAVAYIASSVAPKAQLVVVRMGTPVENSFPRTTELMSALDFCVKESLRLRKPMAINVSFGNNYGGHDGESLLETFINQLSLSGQTTICVGTGNEGLGRNHLDAIIVEGKTEVIRLAVGPMEPSLNLQIWKFYADDMEIELISPSGMRTGYLTRAARAIRYRMEETELLVYYGFPKPYSQYQEIFIEFLPTGSTITYGEWKIEITGRRIRSGQIDMWLPSVSVLGIRTGFLQPSPQTTLTIPSTSASVISVGAYDAHTLSYAPFSGRGFTRFVKQVKPDLVAPGVDISTKAPGGTEVMVSGTSFATPFVTGGAALLMEWGIVKGNDPYLYGEKVKAYLINGARKLPGIEVWPNPEMGWGALCVSDSLPK